MCASTCTLDLIGYILFKRAWLSVLLSQQDCNKKQFKRQKHSPLPHLQLKTKWSSKSRNRICSHRLCVLTSGHPLRAFKPTLPLRAQQASALPQKLQEPRPLPHKPLHRETKAQSSTPSTATLQLSKSSNLCSRMVTVCASLVFGRTSSRT